MRNGSRGFQSFAPRTGLRSQTPARYGFASTAGGNGQPLVQADQSRKNPTPSARVPRPKEMTFRGLVAKTKTQPAKAISAGTGYSHIRNGRGVAGACLRKR